MRKLLVLATAVALPFSAACTVHQDTAPSASGPAEAALSLKMAANPDHIAQDGSQSAAVSVTAYDAGGHPIAVQVHLTLSPSGFGTMTTDVNGNLITTTDASHPTTVSYIPPAASSGSPQTVTITGTMVGPNSVTSSTQQVSVVVSPATSLSAVAPAASFTATPSNSITLGNAVTLDASASCGGQLVGGTCPTSPAITSLTWNFGDKTSGTGKIIGHTYTTAGTYTVTLTVANDRGLVASSSQSIVVAAAASVTAPTAAFSISPTSPGINQDVFFNGSSSTAASGHSIQSYTWDFGDGATGSGASVSHSYTRAGTFSVNLTVKDDVGQTSTKSSTVTVSSTSSQIVASFVFSPTDASVTGGTNTIQFDATGSFSTNTITTYAWDFGDPVDNPHTGSGKITTFTFTKKGTYVVRLTVTDSAGLTATITQSVTVAQ